MYYVVHQDFAVYGISSAATQIPRQGWVRDAIRDLNRVSILCWNKPHYGVVVACVCRVRAGNVACVRRRRSRSSLLGL